MRIIWVEVLVSNKNHNENRCGFLGLTEAPNKEHFICPYLFISFLPSIEPPMVSSCTDRNGTVRETGESWKEGRCVDCFCSSEGRACASPMCMGPPAGQQCRIRPGTEDDCCHQYDCEGKRLMLHGDMFFSYVQYTVTVMRILPSSLQCNCRTIVIDLHHAITILVMFPIFDNGNECQHSLRKHGIRLLFRPASVWLQ